MEEVKRERGVGKQDWIGVVEAQSRSGQSGRSYCREHDVPYKLFLYHRRKFLRTRKRMRTGRRGQRRASSFVPVQISTAGRVVLRLPSGIILESERYPEARWIVDLSRELTAKG